MFGNPSYGITRRPTGRDFPALVAATRDALAAQGFGVLTEIDMQATLKKKLDVDMEPYLILGACAPPFAHQAVTAEMPIGLLLPCNVVVARDASGLLVSAIDPRAMFQIVGREDVAPIADAVRERLVKALDSLM
jgi:uncharacterized protein (DUF302 family)